MIRLVGDAAPMRIDTGSLMISAGDSGRPTGLFSVTTASGEKGGFFSRMTDSVMLWFE